MLVDLTLSLSSDNPIFAKLAAPGKAALLAAGHLGTHLDSLLHRPIPPDWMDREAVMLDARGFGAEIGLGLIDQAPIRAGDFVLIHTGHLARHAYGTDAYFADHPVVSWPLITALLDRGVSFIGIDGPALRTGGDEHARADRLCEENGAYVVENLANMAVLQEHAPPRFAMRVAWIAHGHLTGLPVKVVAVLP